MMTVGTSVPAEGVAVPLVPDGLPREDTMVHIADSLEALSTLSNLVFETINLRVT